MNDFKLLASRNVAGFESKRTLEHDVTLGDLSLKTCLKLDYTANDALKYLCPYFINCTQPFFYTLVDDISEIKEEGLIYSLDGGFHIKFIETLNDFDYIQPYMLITDLSKTKGLLVSWKA